jgi:hypothetical protein
VNLLLDKLSEGREEAEHVLAVSGFVRVER